MERKSQGNNKMTYNARLLVTKKPSDRFRHPMERKNLLIVRNQTRPPKLRNIKREYNPMLPLRNPQAKDQHKKKTNKPKVLGYTQRMN